MKNQTYTAEISNPSMKRFEHEKITVLAPNGNQAQQNAINACWERQQKDGKQWGVVRVY